MAALVKREKLGDKYMKIYEYRTTTRFSDTDSYGVVHHSNYFRLLEEARIDLMENELGILMDDMEVKKIQFPVTKIEAKYKHIMYGRERILIQTLLEYNGTSKLVFHYKILNGNNECVFEGLSEHIVTKNQELLFYLPEELENKVISYLQGL